jgi:hypothetical protein
LNLFGSVVAVAFQSVFRAEMHQNDVFLFLKIIFEINVSKRSKTLKKNNFKQK